MKTRSSVPPALMPAMFLAAETQAAGLIVEVTGIRTDRRGAEIGCSMNGVGP